MLFVENLTLNLSSCIHKSTRMSLFACCHLQLFSFTVKKKKEPRYNLKKWISHSLVLDCGQLINDYTIHLFHSRQGNIETRGQMLFKKKKNRSEWKRCLIISILPWHRMKSGAKVEWVLFCDYLRMMRNWSLHTVKHESNVVNNATCRVFTKLLHCFQ